ncbi:MAG: hypothetical protein A4E39_00631 [Methanoregulaceae archaeon PtaB.Bin152]|nr:MAG: hypothetical protein A4E39_00631 [Methanoregulaceae archaeon PtaB.Bin152]
MTYDIFRRCNALFAVWADRTLSRSPYFHTSESSSNSMFCLVLVGREMEGIVFSLIWSYHRIAMETRRSCVFWSISSLGIEIHHHHVLGGHPPYLKTPSPCTAVFRTP